MSTFVDSPSIPDVTIPNTVLELLELAGEDGIFLEIEPFIIGPNVGLGRQGQRVPRRNPTATFRWDITIGGTVASHFRVWVDGNEIAEGGFFNDARRTVVAPRDILRITVYVDLESFGL